MDGSPQLGKYRLIALLATGGMGEVFLARQEGPAGFAKSVVIKRILRHLAFDQGFVDMFLNEARLAALLSHPNIVQIFELGHEDEAYFIAMEYVQGRSLRGIRQRLADQGKQALAPVLAARICAQALQGLHYAHSLTDDRGKPLGIVHRDISPDNVLVSFSGVVKLVDFGIAKASVAVSSTQVGTLKGKFAYMAPEQLRGGVIDRRADLYAMGVLLYELLAGARPYAEPSDPALIHSILSLPPLPLRDRNPALPDELERIVMKALEREASNRWSSAEEMSGALEHFIHASGETLSAGHIGAFIKELFGPEALSGTPGIPEPIARRRTLSEVSRVGPGLGTVAIAGGPGRGGPPGAALGAVLSSAPTQVVEVDAFGGEAGAPAPRPLTAALASTAPNPATAVRAPVTEPLHRRRLPLLAVAAATGALVATVGLLISRPQPAAEIALAPAPPPPPEVVIRVVPREEVRLSPPVAPAIEAPQRVQPSGNASKVRHPLRNGKVTVRVNPWAEVFYAGRSLGITPMSPVEVPPGNQTFTFKNKDLNREKRVTVFVPAGGSVVLKADLFE